MSQPFDTPRIERGHWWALGILGVLVGIGIYVASVLVAYAFSLTVLKNAAPEYAANWAHTDASDMALNSLKQFGITDNENDKLANSLQRGFADTAWKVVGDKRSDNQVPVLAVVPKFLNESSCDGKCLPTCAKAFNAAFARLLLGWPGSTNQDKDDLVKAFVVLAPPKVVDRAAKEAACKDLQRAESRWGTPAGAFFRTEPLSPRELATVLLSEDKCVGPDDEHQKCRLLSALFQAALDNDNVRLARALWVNFFYGWERALVWSLAATLTFALLYLRHQRDPLRDQKEWLDKALDSADRILDNRKLPERGDQTPKTQIRKIKDAFDQRCKEKKKWASGPQVIHELVDAMDECVATPDRRHLSDFAALHLGAIERQREVLNALVTIFPAVGLMATLRGLIHALSGASGIVASAGDAKTAAVTMVTTTLSSSFATTLCALIAMTIFAVFNLVGGNREKSLIDETYKKLLAVFWPGR